MNINSTSVQVGSVVTVVEAGLEEQETYRLVLPHEADPTHGFVSVQSPFGKALLNQAKGVTVNVAAPKGEISFVIVAVA